jgi:thioredoxin 1
MNASDAPEPTREEIDRTLGPLVLDFGAAWCGFCQTIRPHLTAQLKQFPAVRRVTVEDGKGKPLGRTFQVKLWPTFVFLRDGQEIKRTVRPSGEEIRDGLTAITSTESAQRQN